MAASSVFHYADVVKDILLTIHLKNKVLGSTPLDLETLSGSPYPFILICAFIAIILAIEVTNLMMMIISKRVSETMSKLEMFIMATLVPLAPEIIAYAAARERIKEVRLSRTLALSETSSEKLRSTMARRWNILLLKAELRSNENIVEHFPQLTLLLILILTELSATSTVQTIGNIIIDGNAFYVTIGIAISIFSLVRGQISYLEAMKCGHMRPLAKYCILPAYYLISTMARVFAFIILVTPILGLFGCLQLSKMSLIPGEKRYVSNILFPNRTMISMEMQWRPHQLRMQQSM